MGHKAVSAGRSRFTQVSVQEKDANLGCRAEAGDESAGAAGFDHVGGEGLDDLGERGVDGGGIFGRRQEELEALVEGAVAGHLHAASAMAEMEETELASANGGGTAMVSVVVEVGA